MQKLSIIRFKPKPECFDEFVASITAFNGSKHRIFHLMRNSEILTQDAADGVSWLDGQRHLLQEFDAINQHTIALSGDLIHSTIE